MGRMTVAVSEPVAADVLELLAAHREWATRWSPPEDVHALDATALVDEAVTVFAARDANGLLLGTAALQHLEPGHGEVKAMHTVSAARGRGIARVLLAQVIEEARSRGYRRVSLETGSMAAFGPARALYASAGFEPCGPFSGYRDSPHSAFMSLQLA